MSKLLKRALKSSIFPAILMIAAKTLGIFIVSIKDGQTVEIGNDVGGVFSTQLYFDNPQTAYFVNSISDLIMLLAIALPTAYQVIKVVLFQSTFTNPRTIVKIAQFNILKWVTKDDTNFVQIFVWCIFLWLCSGVVIKNALQGDTYTWIAYLAGVFSLLCGLGILKAFEIEINRVYHDSKKYY